jgi:hypothetical protein
VARIAGIAGEAELTFTRKSPAIISADLATAPDNGRQALTAEMIFQVKA